MHTRSRIQDAEQRIASDKRAIENHQEDIAEARALIADEERKLKRYRKTRAAELRAEADALD